MLSLIFWAQNWLNKSQAKSGRFISSAPLGIKVYIYILENSHKQLQVLAKSKTQLQHWKCQQCVVPRSNSRCLSKKSKTFQANCSKNFVFCSMFTADKAYAWSVCRSHFSQRKVKSISLNVFRCFCKKDIDGSFVSSLFKTKRTKYFSSFMADVEENPRWGFTILFCCRIKMSPTHVRICDSAEAHNRLWCWII